MKRCLLSLVLLFVFCSTLQADQHAAPRVVVSIKPIHALAAAVMEGVGDPQLIIKGAGSPHGYSLRPSEARMLAEADLVVWIGEGLETFLAQPLENLAVQADHLTLAQALSSHMLPIRDGGAWERHAHDDHAHDDHAHDNHAHDNHAHDNQSELDHHIWTSPLVAKEIVELIADKLVTMDPTRAAKYRANAVSTRERLDQLYQDVKAQVQPVASVPYLVFHDAYQYFERDFDLSAVGSVTIDTERTPGVRRVNDVREKIVALNARAVFSEPQFQSRLVDTVLEGTGAGAGVLDPVGADLAEGPEAYFSLIRTMGKNILSTLQ
ncbi:MAG: zinc ABC transporter substrate-binding protein [Pelovirga sp.]